MYCYQRSQYIRLNSKKNSFRGNYMRKYGIHPKNKYLSFPNNFHMEFLILDHFEGPIPMALTMGSIIATTMALKIRYYIYLLS